MENSTLVINPVYIPPMPRTCYKAVFFIREIDELPTIAYIFELLFDKETDSEWSDLEHVEFCEQI
jgi:hypothetical protein